MKQTAILAASVLAAFAASAVSCASTGGTQMSNENEHYTFELKEGVTRTPVTFTNRFGIALSGDLYLPANGGTGLAAVAVCGPFGAVKEQASGLYANEMASRGFAALAFDPSFTGESGGEARAMNSPDINTEDFQAAVDFLSVQDNIDPERIGIIGICGWGGMALNTAALDTRIKATVSST
ncbi:MAG TPA: alpha/beta hydrolase, partial [Candidatus Treponema faecavium]|nr:alpha/beta hydrolase [Candidatus Treponema faecavium]